MKSANEMVLAHGFRESLLVPLDVRFFCLGSVPIQGSTQRLSLAIGGLGIPGYAPICKGKNMVDNPTIIEDKKYMERGE